MATFRVGQRVRVNYPETWCHGMETSIRGVGVLGRARGRNFYGYEIAIRKRTGTKFPFFVFEASDLEPIQPERNQVIAWSECEWMPEHLREVA